MLYKKRSTVVLFSGLLLSIVGCGGNDSSANQPPQLNELSVAIVPLSKDTKPLLRNM